LALGHASVLLVTWDTGERKHRDDAWTRFAMSPKKSRAAGPDKLGVASTEPKRLDADGAVLDLSSSELEDAIAIDDGPQDVSGPVTGRSSGGDSLDSFLSSLAPIAGVEEDRDHWRERAVLWRERALAAELVAKMLQRNLDDLRAHIEDLRDHARTSPAPPSRTKVVNALYAPVRQAFESLYITFFRRRTYELTFSQQKDPASGPDGNT
jgi:hypothetical protein